MRKLRFSFFALLALVLAVLPACASGGGTAEGGEPAVAGGEVTFVVNNDLVVPSNLSVYLVPSSGSRRLLGNVTPGTTETFTYAGSTAGGMYRLMARTTAGNEIVSTPFNLIRGEQIRWILSTNSILTG